MQQIKHIAPVGIAHAGESVGRELKAAVNALVADAVPIDGGILAVDIEDFAGGGVFLQLRDGVDQLANGVGRLPFQADIVHRHFFKHHVPGAGRVSDVAGVVPPITAHRAVFKCDANAAVRRVLAKLGESSFKARHGFLHALALHSACKGADQIGAEEVHVVDGLFEVIQMLLILDGVAVEAERGDLLTGGRNGLHHAGRKFGKLHAVIFHVEADLKAFVALIHHRRQIGHGMLSGHACADVNLIHKEFPSCVLYLFFYYSISFSAIATETTHKVLPSRAEWT